jgi:hypothetical protein
VVAARAIEEFLMSSANIREVRLVFFTPREADLFLKNHSFTA